MSERLIGKNTKDQLSIQEMHEKYNLPEIMSTEQEAWKKKDIPLPPNELFEVLDRAHEKGYTTLEPHYFPEREFTQESKWPGKGIKPEDYFFRLIKSGELPQDSNQLYEMWFLIDNTQSNHEFPISNPLPKIFESLRNKGKIYVPSKKYYTGNLSLTSRSGVTWNEIYTAVNPAIAEMFEISKKMVRLPRFIERNIIGNLFHPEWNKTVDIFWQQWEWMEDKLSNPKYKRALLCGGTNRDSQNKGLSRIEFTSLDDKRMYYSFRPMITFPIQESDKIKAREISKQVLSPVFLKI